MRFAIYGRKSVYSDTSDSVENQFRMCRDFINLHFPDDTESVHLYPDEGFSGANTDRPQLRQLMQDVRAGIIDALVVYQLDRLSRDVRDFSNIYAEIDERNVKFVSIKENIDTSTPIGKAMTMITMVFAQMERETIAARVTDNMIGLAMRGFWTAGNPPYGYERKQITVDGKKHVTIVPVPEAARYVENIFDEFLDKGYSLQGMETAFKQQGIRTVNGGFFSSTQLYKLLSMPFCAPATPRIRDYWISQGCQVEGSEKDWDGKHGVMIYGRSTERKKKHTIQPRNEWLVCVGAHEPFISEEKWLAAQEQFGKNRFEKKQKYDIPLLKGVVRCAKCGNLLQVSRKKLVNGVTSHYFCLTRSRKGVEACDMRMLKCDILDSKAMAEFQGIGDDPELIRKHIDRENPVEAAPDVSEISKKIASQQARIDRLTASLAEAEESAARKYIVAEIERQDLSMAALKKDLEIARTERLRSDARKKTLEERVELIRKLCRTFDGLSAAERNGLVRDIVGKCTWDGKTLFILF